MIKKVDSVFWLKQIKEKFIKGGDESFDQQRREAIDEAIRALIYLKVDLDEYRARLVDKYSDGDEATDFDNGITTALDILDEMEENAKNG